MLLTKGKHGSKLSHMLQGSSGAVSAGATGVAGSVTIASSVHRFASFICFLVLKYLACWY